MEGYRGGRMDRAWMEVYIEGRGRERAGMEGYRGGRMGSARMEGYISGSGRALSWRDTEKEGGER